MRRSAVLDRLPSSTPGSSAGFFLRSALVVMGLLLGALWATTQWAAWRFGFHPALGIPLFSPSPPLRFLLGLAAVALLALAIAAAFTPPLRRLAPALLLGAVIVGVLSVGPLYTPWSFLVWDWRYGRSRGAAPVFSRGHWMIVIPAHAALLVAIVLSSRRARKLSGESDSHGSARWANAREIKETGMTSGPGVFLAREWKSERRRGKYLRHGGPEHVLGFAPSRSGKGVGWVLPTLLTWPESALVHDIKGENWALSAGYRQRVLGNLCLRFDPTCKDGSAARYNPLLEVRLGPDEVRDVQNIADMLVDPDGTGAKNHWDLTAEELLVGAMLHVLYVGQDKSLGGCLTLLSNPYRRSDDVLEIMLRTEHDLDGSRGWTLYSTGEPTRTHPVVAGTARALLDKSENERSGVISSALRCLSLFRDEIVAENTAACDFQVLDLMQHERPVSLYLTVPPSDLSRTRPLLRLLVQQLGRRLTERMAFEDGRGVPHYRHRLLLLMDEFPSLGRLEFFQTQLAHLAGYGIQAFLIVQDLSQLYAAYGRDESIVSNCAVRVAFAPNRIETAKLLSDMAGTMTVHRSRRMYSGNRLSPWLSHVMASEEETQRPLLTPDEVMRLPEDATLVFKGGHRPIYAGKIRYFEEAGLLERARIPAPANSDRIGDAPSPWKCLAIPNPKDVPRIPSTHPSDPAHVKLLPEKAEGADTKKAEVDCEDLAVHDGRKLT
ncbi:MAG TPA: IncP-type conjugal transfer protein TraG [Myxococcota bacterium]|nr:IncP-type conjugal transfer protein TraG [Myxococcota bacterium]